MPLIRTATIREWSVARFAVIEDFDTGKLVRLFAATMVDDATAAKIFRDVAVQIEQQMTYLGEIRVTDFHKVHAVTMGK